MSCASFPVLSQRPFATSSVTLRKMTFRADLRHGTEVWLDMVDQDESVGEASVFILTATGFFVGDGCEFRYPPVSVLGDICDTDFEQCTLDQR